MPVAGCQPNPWRYDKNAFHRPRPYGTRPQHRARRGTGKYIAHPGHKRRSRQDKRCSPGFCNTKCARYGSRHKRHRLRTTPRPANARGNVWRYRADPASRAPMAPDSIQPAGIHPRPTAKNLCHRPDPHTRRPKASCAVEYAADAVQQYRTADRALSAVD